MFIDDILIYSQNENKNKSHLRLSFQVLKEHKLCAKFSMCKFLVRSVAFLVQIISGDGVEVDLKKTDAVRN